MKVNCPIGRLLGVAKLNVCNVASVTNVGIVKVVPASLADKIFPLNPLTVI